MCPKNNDIPAGVRAQIEKISAARYDGDFDRAYDEVLKRGLESTPIPGEATMEDGKSDDETFYDAFAHVYDGEWEENLSHGEGDVQFYRELAREADGPALEVGVGTGRVYLELVADGFDVDGIDVSDELLARLREKAAARDLEPSVWNAGITDFDADREYGLVYAPGRIFNNLATLAEQRTATRNVERALAPGGRFAFDTSPVNFESIVENIGEAREQTVVVDGTEYLDVTKTVFEDEVEQMVRTERTLYLDGDVDAEKEKLGALIPKRQFELLFEVAGFDDWTVYGGFNREPLTSTDQSMVWIARA